MSKKHLQENFYKRLKHLGGVTSSNNPSSNLSTSTLIDYQRANDGVALGIVKESHHYYIKTSSSKNEKLGAKDFAYIGGIENKLKYNYSSLAEAEKVRNMYLNALNESHSKKFKKIAINEGENIAKAQTNGDALNADKAQGEADKSKGKEPLKDKAPEKQIGATPSAKEIILDKTQVKPKTVDDTKTGGKVTITNKQVSPKVVKENFGQEELPETPTDDTTPDVQSTPAAPIAAGMDSDAAGIDSDAADSGSEDTELDAAAAALDSLGAGDAEGSAPTADAAPAPDADGAIDGAMPDADQSIDGDAGVKDIEKLTGKVTQKIRSANLTPEMTKGFLKSYITAFSDKLPELDHEDRKELAASILKDKNDSDMGIGDQAVSSTEDAEEKEIEETINAHLAEMGITESDVNIEGSAESSDHKPFKDYVKARGYNAERVDEISLMEMVSLVNGYTNECGEINPDVQGLAEFVTTEVAEKVAESGNSLFENLMKPFGEKIKQNKKAYATEAVIPSINENFGEDDDAEDTDDEGSEEGEAETAIFGAEKDGDTDDVAAISVSTENEPHADIETPAMSIAPAGETLGAGAVGADASKTVTLDLNNNTISVTMNESTTKKLEKIIQKKIQEQLEGKKSPINESKKSALSAFIDEEVSKAIAIRRKKIEERLSK